MSLGSELREQRQSQDISLSRIQEETKISLRYLEAIESDHFERLPGGVFNKGFLRGYCETLGLDPEPVLRRYEAVYHDSAAPPALALAPQTKPLERQPMRFRPASPAGWTALGVAFLLLVLGLGWWRVRQLEKPDPSDTISKASVARRPETPAPAPVAPDRLRLSLKLHGECWVEIYSDDQRLLLRTLQPGETLSIEAQRQVRMTLGNPAAVELRIQDPKSGASRPASFRQPLDSPIYDLILTRENLSEFILRPAETRIADPPLAAAPGTGPVDGNI
jgi:cytoskeletal protein RodZ